MTNANSPALGRVGIFGFWFNFERYERTELGELAAELEDLGYGALWLAAAKAELGLAGPVLEATRKFVFATGIINVWSEQASTLVKAYQEEPHRDRLLLGIGAGHRESNSAQGYATPRTAVINYLDELTAIPSGQLALAALGPRMLALAAERTLGPHPYLINPEYTASAREAIGSGPALLPEQKVVLETDPERARTIARSGIAMYLGLENYLANLRRLGFTEEDFADGGSDRLVDALVGWGDENAVAERVRAHLDAGADHVSVQVLTEDGDPRPGYRALAPALTEL
ncbi:TIGR03620 family F420-dependent LLM class oxidoreductase [Sciscionella sediminilitoris]|uniref:TIGR03620 family F420-dependent LLM class oxidoreductase n=1 Tax=Sciscionella sediminilitoris TaxID=1445613 RepID=UPI0004DF98E8|nr:TIGR03620 family F420-dependent LLM class oxidoreductase [Sciscionella sp. SE31]